MLWDFLLTTNVRRFCCTDVLICCITHMNKSHASTLPWNGHCVTVYVYRIWCLPDWERQTVSFLLPCCQFMTQTCRCELNPSNCFRSKKNLCDAWQHWKVHNSMIAIKSTFKKKGRKKNAKPFIWKNDALKNYQNIICIFDNEAAKPLFYNRD